MWTHDIRYAFRRLRHSWAFSAAVVIILASSVGVNSAALSAGYATLIRPLPYVESDQLQHVITVDPNNPSSFDTTVDGTTWATIRDHVPALEVAAYGSGISSANVVVNNTGISARQARVTQGFFRVLGVQPLLGREFTSDEDRIGGPNAVVLSYHFWQESFGGSSNVLGRPVLLLGGSYIVVGVMPQRFQWGSDADLWTPLRPSVTNEGEGTNYAIIARLRFGRSLQEARAQVATVTEDIRRRGLGYSTDMRSRLELVPLRLAVTEDLRKPLRILWIAAIGISLLACVNIGAMLLAGTSGRSGEFGIRLALGAKPSTIVRQVIVESIILGVIAGTAGLAVGYISVVALRDLGSTAFPFLRSVELTWQVMAASFLLAVAASVTFAALPAWRAARSDVGFIRTGFRTTATRNRHMSLGIMVATQVALAIPLLMAATLLLRTFMFLWNLPAGFETNDVVTGQFSLQDARYATAQNVNRLFDDVFKRLHQEPGIEAAAVTLTLPYEPALNAGFLLPGESQPRLTDETYVTPEYFSALRIPILEGRTFVETDGIGNPPVVIVNQAFAVRYLNKRGALGTEIRMGGVNRQVVGVVANTVGGHPGWGSFGPLGDFPVTFFPAAQVDSESLRLIHVWFSPSWVVRGSLPVSETTRRLMQAVRQADPLLPGPAVRSFRTLKRNALDEQRLLFSVVDVLAALAMVLAALGIYGLIANLLNERTRELAIRLALGSTVLKISWKALAPGLRWVMIGTAGGAVVTFWLEKVLRNFVWGIKPTDPLSLFIVALGFVAVATVCCLIHINRLRKLDPADTLRAQ